MQLQQALFRENGYQVQRIPRDLALPFILEIHYARRIPPISECFGLFFDGNLEGIVSYGTPPSHTLLKGVCGDEFAKYVCELNRLCLLNNRKNESSILVSHSLKQLGDRIVVSFADTAHNHVGYVYQATNAIYCGMSVPFKEIFVKGKENLHHTSWKGRTFAEMESQHGAENIGYRERSRKHRYVYIVGNRRFVRKAIRNLRYERLPYPKHTATNGR